VCVERYCSAAALRRCVSELQKRETALSLPTDETDESPNGYTVLLTAAAAAVAVAVAVADDDLCSEVR